LFLLIVAHTCRLVLVAFVGVCRGVGHAPRSIARDS
jgi:hypothetical protein